MYPTTYYTQQVGTPNEDYNTLTYDGRVLKKGDEVWTPMWGRGWVERITTMGPCPIIVNFFSVGNKGFSIDGKLGTTGTNKVLFNEPFPMPKYHWKWTYMKNGEVFQTKGWYPTENSAKHGIVVLEKGGDWVDVKVMDALPKTRRLKIDERERYDVCAPDNITPTPEY